MLVHLQIGSTLHLLWFPAIWISFHCVYNHVIMILILHFQDPVGTEAPSHCHLPWLVPGESRGAALPLYYTGIYNITLPLYYTGVHNISLPLYYTGYTI